MLSIAVNISGDETVMRKLKKLESLEDFKKALEVIGEGMVHYYSEDVFKSQGGQFGPAWDSLSMATKIQKAKHYRAYANVPLIRTGKMKNSFTYQAEAKRLKVENTAPYFPYHQSSAPRNKLPRRQMIGIDNKLKKMIKEAIQADIDARLAVL